MALLTGAIIWFLSTGVLPGEGNAKLLVTVVIAIAAAVTVFIRLRPVPDLTPGSRTKAIVSPRTEELLLSSCNVTLGRITDKTASRYRDLLGGQTSVFAEQLAKHIGIDDQPGLAFTVDLEIPGEKDPAGIALFLTGKVILAWGAGDRKGVAFYDAVIPISEHEQIMTVGKLPAMSRLQPSRIRLRIDGTNGSHTLDVFDIEGMEAAISMATGVAGGSITLNFG